MLCISVRPPGTDLRVPLPRAAGELGLPGERVRHPRAPRPGDPGARAVGPRCDEPHRPGDQERRGDAAARPRLRTRRALARRARHRHRRTAGAPHRAGVRRRRTGRSAHDRARVSCRRRGSRRLCPTGWRELVEDHYGGEVRDAETLRRREFARADLDDGAGDATVDLDELGLAIDRASETWDEQARRALSPKRWDRSKARARMFDLVGSGRQRRVPRPNLAGRCGGRPPPGRGDGRRRPRW